MGDFYRGSGMGMGYGHGMGGGYDGGYGDDRSRKGFGDKESCLAECYP